MTRSTRLIWIAAAITWDIVLIGAALSAELPAGHDCKREWIQACVRSDQDPYRDWYPPKMYDAVQQAEIMKRSRHFCEFDNRGPCKDWPKELKAGSAYDHQLHDGGDGTVNME